MSDDPTILQRIAIGDRTAVDDCIEQYGGLIWSVGRRYLCNTADLEDATQEVFVELWQKAVTFDPAQGTESSFVVMIARRRMVDRLRRSGAAKSGPPLQSIDDADEIGVMELDSLVWGEEVQQIAGCLAKLDSIRKRILVMHLRDGESHGRIADALKLPLGTIKSHARRGLLQMQQCLGVRLDEEKSSAVDAGVLR